MQKNFDFVDFKRMRVSAIALATAGALLVGCSGTVLDNRDIPVAGQDQANAPREIKDGVEVTTLDARNASQTQEAASVEAAGERDVVEPEGEAPVTTGAVHERDDDAEQTAATEESFWRRALDAKNFPDEASHNSAAITLSARSAHAERIQLASLQDVTDVAQSDEPGEEYDGDPFEPVNRFFFAINETLDTFILRPVAVTYGFWVPQGVRNTVRNFLRNLRTPIVLANDIFQGDLNRAETTAARFFLNSTVGVGGLFDVASDEGWDYHNEDFGQTLGVHGFGEGAYLVLPVFGPSSARDTIGMVVDRFLDPLTYLTPWETRVGLAGVTAIDSRSRTIELTDDLKRDSIDYYARIRSLYRQTREDAIRNGEEAPGESGAPSSVSDLETSSATE